MAKQEIPFNFGKLYKTKINLLYLIYMQKSSHIICYMKNNEFFVPIKMLEHGAYVILLQVLYKTTIGEIVATFKEIPEHFKEI